MNKAHPPLLNAMIRHQSLGLGLLALVLFIVGNWHQAVIGFDSRFVLFAQEMLRHGPSFFPTTYGQPYADYLGDLDPADLAAVACRWARSPA